MTEYLLEFTPIDNSTLAEEIVNTEIEKQNQWIKNYLEESDSEVNELNYAGKKIRKYDGERYQRSTIKLHNEIFNYIPCLEDVDQYEKSFDCEGESIRRIVFKVKCSGEYKEFYYDEGACLIQSSKGFHTGNGDVTGAYYGNVDVNHMIYLVCGCL